MAITAIGFGITSSAVVAFMALASAEAWAQEDGASFVIVPDCELLAVNADGNVVTGSAGREAARWTRESGLTIMQRPPGLGTQFRPKATAISWDGRVMAGATHATGPRTACWWDETGTVHMLPDPATGSDNGYVYCISGNGEVIGGHAVNGDGSGTKATLWSGGSYSFLTIPGVNAMVLSVSFGGDVAMGVSLVGAVLAPFRADVWGGFETLTSATHGPMTPWGMSTDGSTIVGSANNVPAVWTAGTGLQVWSDRFPPGTGRVEFISADKRVYAGTHDELGVWVWDAFHGVRRLRDVANAQLGGTVPYLGGLRAMSADGRTFIFSDHEDSPPSDSYVLRLAAPCAADIDDGTLSGGRDGVSEVTDLAAFLIWMNEGDIRCDLDNGSGTGVPDAAITIDDLVYFLVGFEEGC